MTVPDARDFQQLHPIGEHGGVNCTAEAAAWLVAADGRASITGEQVRAASDEPKPDKKSPGLNLTQVDAAVRKLTHIDFDTRLGDPILDAEMRIRDGRWAEVQVMRGVLVDRGFAGDAKFRGSHAITAHTLPGDDIPILGDPLVPFYIRASWSALWAAARGIAGAGRANAMFTRDLVADYAVSIRPTPGHLRREFRTFVVKKTKGHPDGEILRRELDVTTGGGIDRPCTPPRHYPWDKHVGRSLVQIIGGHHDGEFVLSHWAREVK